MALNTINPNLNITMSYEGTQKGAIAPYSLAEHRYFITEPENFGNITTGPIATSVDGVKISAISYNYDSCPDIKIDPHSNQTWAIFNTLNDAQGGPIYIFTNDNGSSFSEYASGIEGIANTLLPAADYAPDDGEEPIGQIFIGGSFSLDIPASYYSTKFAYYNTYEDTFYDLGGGLTPPLNSGQVFTLLLDKNYDDKVVLIGGSFDSPSNNLCLYDIVENQWVNNSDLSIGNSGEAVSCLAQRYNNFGYYDTIIGGRFTSVSSSVDGVRDIQNLVLHNWDDNSFRDIGQPDGVVYVLYYDESSKKLFVGGDFTKVVHNTNEISCKNICCYNFLTQQWSSLGEEISFNGGVRAITIWNNQLYIGGDFTENNDPFFPKKLSHIAKYDLNNGTISAVFNGLNSSVNAMISGDKLYIGGNYSSTVFGKQTITTKDIFKPFDAANYGNPRLAPRLQYVFNNHLPSSTGSTINGAMKLFDLDPENPLVPLKTYEQYPESIFVLNDAYVYETDKLSGKNPFFNSYEEYFEDLKPLSQKYSIIPEFRMDNVIEYFIKEKNADFNAGLTSSYLSLDSNINHLDDINSIINSSNEIKTFAQDVNSNVSGTTFSISISGLKKLLPYNGFYPQQRVAQLADKFINSLIDSTDTYLSSDNVEYDTNLSNGTPRDQQILTLLQPLFAPGILMNTIKSSIAVDWPTFIGNYGTYSSGNLNRVPSFYTNIRNGGFGITNYTASYILSAQKFDFRFPFESLIEFDTIIPSSFKKENNNLYYLNPTYYSTDVVSGSDRNNLRYPSYNLSSGSLKKLIFKDNLYKLGMHNFLAEIPNFFLQNGLNNFISEPIQKVVPVSGTAYVIDVVLDRDQNKYKEFIQHPLYESLRNNNENYISGVYLPPSTDSLYGPPCEWVRDVSGVPLEQYGIANFTLKFVDSPAYAPYVAPYYYGKSVARIVFLPNETREYALDEILQNASSNSYYINEEAKDLFRLKGGFLGSGVGNYLAYKERMNLSSSVNLFSKTEIKNTVIDAATGIATEVADSLNPKYSWVIQTKFETPSINFAKMSDYNNLGMNFLGGTKTSYVEGVYTNLYKGLWTSYGEPVKDGEGIKMYLEYDKDISLSDIPGAKDIKPLTNLIEFGGLVSQEQKTIGLLANKKKIQEAIIVIPYVTKPLTSEYPSLIKPINGENGVYTSVAPIDIPKYFAIDKAKISKVLGLPFDSSALSFEQIKKQVNSNKVNPNNSIIKTIKAMTEFVIPPHLNWIKNRSIEPFVMYVFPFSTELDTEDLSDIWQGLMPKASRNVKEEEIVISHSLKEDEMFHGKKLPEGIKFKIFKAKQQANINYYKLTADSKDDKNFKFKFGNSGEAKIPEYSYNWPYDYFSLVELVNVKASLEVDNSNTTPQETVVNPTEILKALQDQNSEKALKNLANKTFKTSKIIK